MAKIGRYTFLALSGTAVILAGLVLAARPLRLIPIASHWIVFAGLLVAGMGLVCLGTASVLRNGQPSSENSRPSFWLRLAILGAGMLTVLTVVALGVLVKKGKDVPAADFVIHGPGPECCMGKLTRMPDGELAISMDNNEAMELTKYGLDTSPSVEQLRAATELYEKTKAAAAKFEDYNYTRTKGGYTLSTREILGEENDQFEHVYNPDYMTDGRTLDPERPESLVYYMEHPGGKKRLVCVMYIMPPSQHGPQIGGPLTRWHFHSRIGFCSDKDGIPRVKPASYPQCPPGLTLVTPEMMHVWLVDNPYGVFSHMMSLTGQASGHDHHGHHED